MQVQITLVFANHCLPCLCFRTLYSAFVFFASLVDSIMFSSVNHSLFYPFSLFFSPFLSFPFLSFPFLTSGLADGQRLVRVGGAKGGSPVTSVDDINAYIEAHSLRAGDVLPLTGEFFSLFNLFLARLTFSL
jgi:hypothetical protein